ncbi:uncharacterized protein EI90DRAFT_3052621 [Cantharellus anzutake]|uniref:uncharacterized protein n=1 Tax=Cantharellus anzutake TaxID=1750568 RepID=UPI0019034F19|nr:uncharacterized protein EI90DRAFT_3104399 [Cantharellus anzutake]XP_038917640.1 uncharacterized protein EI90DRAFT_3052621 [Cantharellus anzutake]KAF8309694.1 hypothetical protein EI90DRAFT_3104399 [Cantharellus anzutake]KAF8333635.1 hypothetical protein EI90DRAFT_3052621 [Cantharellus anzutake]
MGSSSSEEIISTRSLDQFLVSQDRLIKQASKALPHSFDKCTYSLGHIKQAVYWCKTCNGTFGLCSACSIACHGNHEQIELFPKRNFRCDCPTSSSPISCMLHRLTEEPNAENPYGQNFRGIFCRCGKPYDPTAETETMLQCLVCEDWYHESCLNLRKTEAPSLESKQDANVSTAPMTDLAEDSDSEGELEEEDDPNLLIAPSSYESLVCSACVLDSPFLSLYAGTLGVRMIIRGEHDNSWIVIGGADIDSQLGDQARPDIGDYTALQVEPSGGSQAPHLAKRALSPDIERNGGEAKRQRRGASPPSESKNSPGGLKPVGSVSCSRPPENSLAQATIHCRKTRKPLTGSSSPSIEDLGDCDIFLSEGFRLRWCRCADCTLMFEWEKNHPRYRFLFEEEPDLYEPPEDPDSGTSLEELGMRALDRLPRDKTIDGIQAYNNMRDELIEYLRPFAASGRVVEESDMTTFFKQQRAKLATEDH